MIRCLPLTVRPVNQTRGYDTCDQCWISRTPVPQKILVVEDDESIRQSLEELLQLEGYAVASADNGETALRSLAADSTIPDVILLDLMMPVKDGFQFIEEKNHDPRIKHIPVIIMSADGHILEKKERAGAAEYLRKPVDIEQVLSAIAKHCGS